MLQMQHKIDYNLAQKYKLGFDIRILTWQWKTFL
jgi:hypothetical protein